jgi:sugar (pentulose or hexulose) kinase
MARRATAVFDVGKTNKKLIIFDDDLQELDASYHHFESADRGDYAEEPLHEIESWFLQELKRFAAEYDIQAVAVTTHGAAFVCLDEDGRPCTPVIDYTTEPGEDFHREFYREAGGRDELQIETATLELKALVNPAKGIYFLKQRFPERFKKTRHILFLPQYFSYLLTGEIAADYTYAGCHTYLWNFTRNEWSSAADKLGIRTLLPRRVMKPWEVLGTVKEELAAELSLSPGCIVTPGIHDSNASLLPYLVDTKEDFVLNSTGTWCVAMHPMEKVFFTDDEIGKAVFYNISAFGTPVKTSLVMGGPEFDAYTALLKELHGERPFPDYHRAVYEEVIREKNCFILPGVVEGMGQFPGSKPRAVENEKVFSLSELQSGQRVPQFFRDYEKAYAVLNLSLAIQTKPALERVGLSDGLSVFTEGGFRNNPDYNALLCALFPDAVFHLSDIKEATSFGAGMTAKIAREGSAPEELSDIISIEKKKIIKERFDGLSAYVDKFESLV